MFKHYIKIAWRNLLKYKTQSVISILGLTMGVVFLLTDTIGTSLKPLMIVFIPIQIGYIIYTVP